MAPKFLVPPIEVIAETTACLNAGMKPEQLLQILAVLKKAVSEGNNRFNMTWHKEDAVPEARN